MFEEFFDSRLRIQELRNSPDVRLLEGFVHELRDTYDSLANFLNIIYSFLVGGLGILTIHSFWLALQESIAEGHQAPEDRRLNCRAKREQHPGGGVQIDDERHHLRRSKW